MSYNGTTSNQFEISLGIMGNVWAHFQYPWMFQFLECGIPAWRCIPQIGGWDYSSPLRPSATLDGAILGQYPSLMQGAYRRHVPKRMDSTLPNQLLPTRRGARRSTKGHPFWNLLGSNLNIGLLFSNSTYQLWFWIYHLFPFSILLWAALPRTYPPLFGRKLTRLHRLFCKRKGNQFPESNRNGCHLISWFSPLDWGDLWDDAKMYDVMSWLRGSRSLDLQDWREAFPRKLQEW